MIGSPRAIPIEELRAVVAHVRAIEARSRPTSRAPNWTYAAFLLILLGSLRAALPGAYLSSSRQTIEESRMRTLQNLGVVSSIAIASVATAQNAVEWRVADGGNGHWYEVVSATGPITWSAAKLAAEAKGAHLVTLTSAAEEDQVWTIASAPSAWVVIPFVSIGPWLGGLQAPNATSPADGWSWVTGEPWIYSAWLPGEPNEGCGSLSEDRLHYIAIGSTPSRTWNDFAGEAACPNYVLPRSYVVEWDADCNNDGIVDYGQISAGELVDTNGNNIPDCCEQGFDCRFQAVQWRTDEGGNGHWYQCTRTSTYLSWSQAQTQCNAKGAALASLSTQAESEWVYTALTSNPRYWTNNGPYIVGPWIGGRGPLGQWRWDDGSPWSFSAWYPGEGPPSPDPVEQFAHYFAGVGPVIPLNAWGDYFDVLVTPSYLAEWSADCNNDGMVDYGQIRNGQLADGDGNGVPDLCEGIYTVPIDFPTIQAAVDAIPLGESRRVRLLPGVYDESVVVVAVGAQIESAVPGQATIRAAAGTRGLTVGAAAGVTSSVTGVVFTKVGASGGGIELASGNLTVHACAFMQCVAPEGGAIRAQSSTIGIVDSSFIECSATGPAGLYGSAGGVHNRGSTCTVTGSSFVRCHAGGAAEAVLNESGSCHIIGCSIIGSDQSAYFGQIYNTGSLLVEDTHFQGANKPAVFAWSPFTVRRCTFEDMLGYSVLDRRFGDYVVDDCDFLRCHTAGPLFMSYYSGRFLIGNSRFCQTTWTGPFVQGAWVDLGGNDFACVTELHVPSEYPTVQAAIDAASIDGPTIVHLAGGVYHESFALHGKNIIIRGAADWTTILNGIGLPASIATFTGGEPPTAGLENIVFRQGSVGSIIYPGAPFQVGGAVYGVNSSAFIRHCRFENNRSDYGGGAYLLSCDMRVEDCIFASNTGVAQGGGLMTFDTTGVVRNCSFLTNQCGLAGAGGGSAFKAAGARNPGDPVLLDGCVVTDNTAGVDGGAVEYYENTELHPGTLQLLNCTITGNRSGAGVLAGAGGLVVTGSMQSTIVGAGTTICGNLPRNAKGPYFLSATASVCDCLADLSGDGIVNGGDLGLLLSAWGPTGPSGVGDVNHDGGVDGADLAIMLGSWGVCH